MSGSGLNFLGGVRVSVRGLRGVRVMALGISKVIKIRTPLTTPGPYRGGSAEREIPNFAGMSPTKKLIEGILRGPLKFIGLSPLLNYAVI